MTMPYEHLIYAQAQLESVTGHLVLALRDAKEQGYSPDWLDAIRKARAHNDETDRQVGNIIVNIRSPQYEQLIEGFQKEG